MKGGKKVTEIKAHIKTHSNKKSINFIVDTWEFSRHFFLFFLFVVFHLHRAFNISLSSVLRSLIEIPVIDTMAVSYDLQLTMRRVRSAIKIMLIRTFEFFFSFEIKWNDIHDGSERKKSTKAINSKMALIDLRRFIEKLKMFCTHDLRIR